jgi:predicted amidophosphoribosyltransferase
VSDAKINCCRRCQKDIPYLEEHKVLEGPFKYALICWECYEELKPGAKWDRYLEELEKVHS